MFTFRIFDYRCILFKKTKGFVVYPSLTLVSGICICARRNVCLDSAICSTLSRAAARATRQRQDFLVLFGKYKSFTIHTMHIFLNGNAVMSGQPPSEQSCQSFYYESQRKLACKELY